MPPNSGIYFSPSLLTFDASTARLRGRNVKVGARIALVEAMDSTPMVARRARRVEKMRRSTKHL